MKKLLLNFAFLAISLLSYGQVNYYDQNKNPITSGDCDLSALGMTLKIPAAAKQYESISISVIYAKNWKSSTGYNVYEKMFPGSALQSEMDFWVLKPGGGSDFKSAGYGNPEMNLLAPCTEPNRKANSYTVSVRILGGTHSGWETVSTAFGGSETVKTYDYTVVAANDDTFTVDFGEASSGATSKSGLYTAGLPFPDKTDITTYEYSGGEPFEGPEQLTLVFRDKEVSTYNSLWIRIIAEKKSNLGDWTMDKIKADIEQDIKYTTNKVSAWKSDFDAPSNKWQYDLSTNKNWFYPGYLVKYGKSGDKELDAKYAAMIESPVSWTEENGMSVLKYENIFQGYEVGGKGGKPFVTRDYAGADKTLYYYAKEDGDLIILAGVYKDYKSAKEGGLTDSEKEFIEKTIEGISAK